VHDDTLDINDVKTIDDVVGGEWVHDGRAERPYWKPTCHEAWAAIRAGVTHVLRSVAGRWSEDNLGEAENEVNIALKKYLVPQSDKRRRTRITNSKFLESGNRGGWLNVFAQRTTRGWIRDRVRVANGDDRVRQAISPGYVMPDETFTEQQKRLRVQKDSLTFDAYQFQFGRGHIPFDEDGLDSREVEHQSPESSDAENVVLLRGALAALPPEDREFMLDYVTSRYEQARSAVDRKRFQRLKSRLRDTMSQTHRNSP
jgi:hypothetical protein